MGLRFYNFYLILILLMMRRLRAGKHYGHHGRPHEKTYCDQEHLPSFMWKINRDSGPPSYLFGTIHVPYTLVWDSIPLLIKKAFEESDCVYFELDLLDPYTINALSNCQLLPNGKRLTDVLPSDLYRRLKRHLDYIRSVIHRWITADQRGRGLYAEYLFNAITGNWERKRPVWVMLMINSLTESDIKSRGIPVLDLFLAQEAQRMNKRTGAVEKVEEQCLPMNDLSTNHVIFALNATLLQHENIRRGRLRPSYTTQDLIRHYNCGSLQSIIFNQVPSLLQSSSKEAARERESAQLLEAYFRFELVIKRNLKMSRKVIDILKSDSKTSYFFAFGAGHFIGRDSIIDVLRASGYKVERVTESVRCQKIRNRSNPSTWPKSQRRKGCGNSSSRQKKLNAQRSDKTTGEKIPGHGGQPQESQTDASSPINKDHNKLNFENGNKVLSSKGTNDLPSLSLPSVGSGSRPTPSTSYARRFQHYSFPKKFNDLWVRLETVTDNRVPLLIRPREDILNEVETGNSYLHAWHPTASATSRFFNHSIFNKLLVFVFYYQLSYMTTFSLTCVQLGL